MKLIFEGFPGNYDVEFSAPFAVRIAGIATGCGHSAKRAQIIEWRNGDVSCRSLNTNLSRLRKYVINAWLMAVCDSYQTSHQNRYRVNYSSSIDHKYYTRPLVRLFKGFEPLTYFQLHECCCPSGWLVPSPRLEPGVI